MRAGVNEGIYEPEISRSEKLVVCHHRFGGGLLFGRCFGVRRSFIGLTLTLLVVMASAAYSLPSGADAAADVKVNSIGTADSPRISPSDDQLKQELIEQAGGLTESDIEQVKGDISEVPAKVVQVAGQPSAIERLFAGDVAGTVSKKLRQFGYNVFRGPVSTFAPVTNVPVGADYIVGPGDSFMVTLWGRANARYTIAVDRNGEVTLPEVGVLKVWGMSFGALHDYLEQAFSRKYTDFKMAVTMARLRTIRVYVVGEVQTPGSYTVSSLSTVINALFAAGGPSQNGTLREIRLLSKDNETTTIDLYNFLLGGDKSKDMRLENGDTIFVPLIGSVVGVAGNVKRPAIYEMSRSMTLSEVLDLAGGVTYLGWLQRVQVERVEKHQKRIVADFDISSVGGSAEPQAYSTVIHDGDVVKVFSVTGPEQNVVYLAGHVVRPGKYELKPGMHLRDLISSYEVLQPQANLESGEIERLVEPDFHKVVIPFNVGRLLGGDVSENIALSRFDKVRVFRWDERISRRVSVSGLVYRPGEYRLVSGMKVSDLIDAAGGLAKNAYLKNAELMRRHVSQEGLQTEKININLEQALAGASEQNTVLKDYDHLIVRPIPELEFDRYATISGEVKFPGTYPIRRGETLSSVIERAGGYTDRAYLGGAVFTRDSARIVQRQRMDELTRELEESMLASTDKALSSSLDKETSDAQQMALAAKKQLLAKLRAAKIDGRVVVKLSPLETLRGSDYDLELEKGDKLVVPETPGVVNVVGEVFNPTAILYEQGRTVRYYLNRVGGLTKEADKKQVSIIRANGSVVSMAQKIPGKIRWDSETHSWVFGGFMNIELNPGDTIVAPRRMDRFLWLRMTKDVTQILFQMALAAGVVLAL